MMDTPRVIC
jgi:hypothetical protein